MRFGILGVGGNWLLLAVWLFGVSTGCSAREPGAATTRTPAAEALEEVLEEAFDIEADEGPIVFGSAEPDSGKAPLSVRFEAEPLDEEQQGLTYRWTFGDGSAESSEQNPTHVYQKAGTYTARVVIRDPAGRTDEDEVEIRVSE